VKLVLDTNVVIDWLVFDDPFMAAFREAVRSGRVTVFTHAHAVSELRRVLAYRALNLNGAQQADILEQYEAQTATLDRSEDTSAIPADLPRGFPRCSDPDDRPFLTLAWRANADALVSRDNEVLALRSRSERFGFQILDVPQLMAAIDFLPVSDDD
jgi:uncharacterized protein